MMDYQTVVMREYQMERLKDRHLASMMDYH